MTKRLVVFGLLLVCLSLLSHAKGDRKTFDITDFSQGLDSYHSPITLPKGFVQDSNNVLFDASGRVAKRQGYTVSWSTKSYQFTNLWTYTDGTNTTWELARSSDQITASNLTGTIVLVATVSANNLVGEANAFGSAYFVDQTQGVYYWNGTSTTYVAGSPKGSIINTFHNRVWVTGAAVPNGNQLYGSKYYDGTTWTTGINPTDPVQYSFGLQDNFDNVTALYVYLDTEYVFKHYAIYALYGFDQTSFQISQLTQECGCIDGNSIQTYEGGLKFVSLRGVENFNGYTCERISNAVKNKVDPAIAVTGFNQQSWTQSSQADWSAGTLFQLSTTAAPPTLLLSTQVAFSTTDFNWTAGTASVNVSTNVFPPNLVLSTYTTSPVSQSNQSNITGFNCNTNNSGNPPGITLYNLAQAFTTSSSSQQVISGGFYGDGNFTNGGCASTYRIKTDNNGIPGSDVVTASVGVFPKPGPSWMTVNFTPTNLLPNTTYWLWIDGCGDVNSADRIYNNNPNSYTHPNFTSVASGGGGNLTGVCNGSTSSYIFQINVQGIQVFQSTGSFISQTFNVGQSTNAWLWNWGTFTTSETDNGQTITYMTQVSSSPNGVWDAPVAITPGGTIASATKQYIEYIASFTTVNVTTSPVLSSVTINTSVMERSSGTFQSQIHNLGSIRTFGNFPVTDSLNGGNINFSLCSSTSPTMGGAGVTVSCSSQTANSQITVATGTYVQWYATFTVTNATQTPTLNSGTVQWFSGNPAQPMSSTIWDNRYWLALTTNNIDSANDSVLVLNTRGVWASFDIHAGAFTQYKGSLYHADSRATGNIYLDNQGESDNGAPIDAHIHTRTESLENVSADDYLYAVYPSALNTGNCNMTTQYIVDSASSTFNLGAINLNEFGSQTVVKLPFPIDAVHQDFGQSVDFIIGTNDALCDWKFFGLTGIYRERPVN